MMILGCQQVLSPLYDSSFNFTFLFFTQLTKFADKIWQFMTFISLQVVCHFDYTPKEGDDMSLE